jgi:hypothetical protein
LNPNKPIIIANEVKVCWHIPDAKYMQLQQLLGLDVPGGSWNFDVTLSPLGNYITSINGELMFNAQKAWLDGKGTLINGERHFSFRYNVPGNSCVPSTWYPLTVIVTSQLD